MTLFERRSSMESFDRWRDQSPTGSERRKLSFNPIGTWEPPVPREAPIGAFEVSKTKRILQVGIAVIYCLLAAGVVFGYAAIKPVLVDEGVYRDKCTKQELKDGVWICYEQELRLNLMFTVAAVSTNVCALPVGTILDRYGPRVASLIGTVFLALGSLLFAFAGDIPFDTYILGYLFLALGGPFVFISSFQLSNTFPQHSGLILALLTGAFDTSSAVFLGYRLIYQGTNRSFNTKKFFLIYLIVPALVFVAQIFIMPSTSYKTVGELVQEVEDPTQDEHASDTAIEEDDMRIQIQNARREHRESVVSEITALLGTKSGDQQKQAEEEKARKSGVWGAMHGKTAAQQIASPWFILITLFTVVQMTRINYFVATIRTQYSELLHSTSRAAHVNEVFDIALPLGGVVAVPFIGAVLDHTSTPFVLALLMTIATVIGIFGIVPEMWAAYVNIALFVVYRPLYYTAVSDYSAKTFGFATFGKVYGLIICLAGLGNFSQAGLDALTHVTFKNDPVPVNVLLLLLALVAGALLVGFVYRKSATFEREQLEEEEEEAQEVLVPGPLGAEGQLAENRRQGNGSL
ncbi:protein fmp42 [Acrodontium crateriforme]|uniref:Protein fmp42 n=1 Tax=Acrodontium crateriforme TaxID=150365 RepID=A0AAQ3RAW0_9PEZI|nr:protein fmp42 [Acrodontium crateriforme]